MQEIVSIITFTCRSKWNRRPSASLWGVCETSDGSQGDNFGKFTWKFSYFIAQDTHALLHDHPWWRRVKILNVKDTCPLENSRWGQSLDPFPWPITSQKTLTFLTIAYTEQPSVCEVFQSIFSLLVSIHLFPVTSRVQKLTIPLSLYSRHNYTHVQIRRSLERGGFCYEGIAIVYRNLSFHRVSQNLGVSIL